MKTTLNKIREHSPCTDGWEKLLKHLGKTQADDEPLSILTILDSNGLNDAIWCLRAVEGRDKEIRLFAVWCARQVQHLLKDQRSIDALDVSERYANGDATVEELNAAEAAAEDAAWVMEDATRDDAWVAMSATGDATEAAAWAARDATAAARVAAEAARAAAWSTAEAAAEDAVWDAVWDTARDEMRLRQEAELRRICGEVEG